MALVMQPLQGPLIPRTTSFSSVR